MAASVKDVIELKSILDEHNRQEKHIGYHILPERFNKILAGTENENKYTFYERERFSFFKDNVDFSDKRVIDIGCNIGYFLFNILDLDARQVTGYEGKKSCGDFLKAAINLAGVKNKFNLHNQYYQFDDASVKYDVGLLLNVIHHTGDDYGTDKKDIITAKENMIKQVNLLSYQVDRLIFQMGFNWKGNRDLCLFANGTKKEMIDYIREGSSDYWDIECIGVAESLNGVIKYNYLNEKNIERNDSLGEFLNRPIFILKSKKFKNN